MKNCRIIIEQNEGDERNTNVYELDDYRVATAICNILDNVAEVDRNNIPQLNFIHHGFYINDEVLETLENMEDEQNENTCCM